MKAAAPALALAAAVALGGCQKAFDAVLGPPVRGYLLEHPELLEEMAGKLQEQKIAQQSEDARKSVAENRKALERDPRDVVINPDGKITVVEFYDYRCGYCKTIAPEVADLVRSNKDIRLVLKEFPIFGGASDLAARTAAATAPGRSRIPPGRTRHRHAGLPEQHRPGAQHAVEITARLPRPVAGSA